MRAVLVAAALGLGLSVLPPGRAEAQQVRLTKLGDVAIGMLSTTDNDITRSQNVCAFATNFTGRYSVRATGSGAGGALTLQGLGAPLPYEVQWAGTPGQTVGTALPANATVGTFVDGDVLETCLLLNLSSASLIVILRSAALAAATAGSYTGTLTLVVAPL